MLEVPDLGLASRSFLGYGHWSLIHPCPKFCLRLDFEGAKNIHVLQVFIQGFGGRWKFPTRVWLLHIDLDMVTGLLYTHVPNFGSYLDFKGAGNIHVL